MSDHQAIYVQLEGSYKHDIRPRKRFHFEAVWIGALDCAEIVDNRWNSTTGRTMFMQTLQAILSGCASKLQKWNKYNFDYIKHLLAQCYCSLSDL